MTGGAWVNYETAGGTRTKWYLRTKPLTIFANGSPRAYGCVAIKRELLALGYTVDGLRTESPVIGDSADLAIKKFQGAKKLTVDGVVGPATAEALFAHRINTEERAAAIPSLAARIVKLESSEDPGAIGYVDADDKGLAQINVARRPVSTADAFDPAFSIHYLCHDLSGAYESIHDWQGAVASWNVGSYWAAHWVTAGKPSSGAWDEKNQVDWYSRAANYVRLVESVSLNILG